MPLIVTAAALLRADGCVLMQQRPAGKAHGGLWEFPGGKLEPGETLANGLARELAEELAIRVAPADCEPLTFTTVPHGAGDLMLALFLCRRWFGEPLPSAADAIIWLPPAALTTLPMPPADIPLAARLGLLL